MRIVLLLSKYDTFRMAPQLMTVKNNPNAINWNLENGYTNAMKESQYPLRAYESGRGAALEISLDSHEINFETLCNQFEHGFDVTLSVPGDDLNFMEDYFRIRLFEETVITIKPKLTTTSKQLRKYDPNHKKCFFDSERRLRFYKKYSQNNCNEECVANFTNSQCGCVKFSQTSK